MSYFFILLSFYYLILKQLLNKILGPAPDSEKETQGIRNAINAKLGWFFFLINDTPLSFNINEPKYFKGKWELFLTLHSFGQYWMLPWGYTLTLPSDYADLENVSKVGAAALKSVYGKIGLLFYIQSK